MAECELCGKKLPLVKARINGILLDVCFDCAKSGHIVDIPKQKTPKVIQQAKVQPEELVSDDYAQKIRQARQRKNMKQEDVAKAMNERLSLISAVESGKRTPDLRLARKLERFFGIKLIDVE